VDERLVAKKQPRKFRVDFRKNQSRHVRQNDLTRQAAEDPELAGPRDERVSGKGALSRRRTIVVDADAESPTARSIDLNVCRSGRVLRAVGSTQCVVQADDDRLLYQCTVRRLLRSIASDERSVVVAGDRVQFLPQPGQTGVIERVEPRQSTLTRGHQYREHILVANVTQAAIVMSAQESGLKPGLIDRFLVSAAKGRVSAGIVLNKCDLVDRSELQSLVGRYSRLGYFVVCTSAQTGLGIEQLKHWLRGQQTVFTGQSGVGKSSLLNAVQPGLQLRTGTISEVTQKGRHTTRSAVLMELFDHGGWVVDTPGLRQLQLWDVQPAEVEGFFPEFRPFVPDCKYANCLHLEDDGCAVRAAVQAGLISQIRYYSYARMVVPDE
jgi:ribosome biogenesis GTPase / thiamine phosphate phosphatase